MRRASRTAPKVQAGQLLGFVGDSATPTASAPISIRGAPARRGRSIPYKYLNRAYRPLFAVLPEGSSRSRRRTVVSTALDPDATSATLKVDVKTLRVWPGGFRIPSVNRAISLTVRDTDSIQLLHTGPTPAADDRLPRPPDCSEEGAAGHGHDRAGGNEAGRTARARPVRRRDGVLKPS
jgi:hypothetical protein